MGVTRFTSDNPTTPDKLSTRYNHTVIVCNKHSLFIIHKPVFCRFQRQNRLVSRVSIAGSCHTWGSQQKFLHRTTSTTPDNYSTIIKFYILHRKTSTAPDNYSTSYKT